MKGGQQRGILTRSRSYHFVQRPAIAFDLDDTLVLTVALKPQSTDFFTGRVRRRLLYVQMRPGLIDFLQQVQRLFDVFFFTASQSEYADQVISKIAPNHPSCRRFCRNSCLHHSGYLVKDLRILRRPLNRIVLVDDCAGSALRNPNQLIHVKPWNGDKKDDLLIERLLPILQHIAREDDMTESVYEVIRKCAYNDIGLFPGLAAHKP
jgi:Dullard-like phosphatase family protein